MKANNFLPSDFYCTECGRKGIPIIRIAGKEREAGHLKKLYCLYCQKETNHAEIRPFGKYNKEDFKKEFRLGRFVNGNRIKKEDLMFCSKEDCEFNVNKRCWNCNYSFDCEYRIDKED